MTPEDKKELDQRRADDEKRKQAERDREQMSWFGRIWDMVSDNFWLILFAVVAFVVIGPDKMKDLWDKGSEMLGGLVDKGIALLPKEWQAGLNAMLGRDVYQALTDMKIEDIRTNMAKEKIPADIINVLAESKQTFQSFLDVAKTANGGKVATSDFTNDKTVFALLTQKPEMARALAAAALKSTDGAPSDTATKIMASLKAIAKDERLDVLLSPQHMGNTKALLASIPGVPKDALETVLKHEVIDGKATPALHNFLTAALTPGVNGAKPDLTGAVDRLAKESPQTRTAIIDTLMKPSKDDSPEIAALKANNGGKALATLRTALGDEKLIAFVGINAGVDERAKMKFVIENRKAFEAFHSAADVGKLGPKTQEGLAALMGTPPAADAPLLAMLNKGDPRVLQAILANAPTLDDKVEKFLRDPAATASIRQLGEDNVVAYLKATTTLPASITPATLGAVLTAVETIRSSGSMNTATGARDTVHVVQTITTMLATDNPAVLKQIKPEVLASFFNNPNNAAAIKTLLEQTKGSLPADQKGMVEALLKNWKTVEKVAADAVGAEFLIAQMTKAKEKKDAPSCKAPGVTLGQEFGLWFKGTDFLKGGKDNIIGMNAEGIKALKHDLAVADCLTLPQQAAATPSRGGHGVAPYVAP